MNNLLLRSISGLFIVAIVVFAILFSDCTMKIVLSVIGVAALIEMLNLFCKSGVKLLFGGWATVVVAIISLLILNYIDVFPLFIFLIFYVLVRFTAELYLKNSRPIDAIGYEFFALIYTILPMILLMQLSERTDVLFVFIIVWINDVGAYLVGSRIGKHRLFERISPKKSWEGFWGGVFFSVLAAFLIGVYWLEFNAIFAILSGIVLSVSAVFGDLFESMFKRSIGVKDSGKIIPGHGGLLDRFDALFFAAPAYYLFCYLFFIIILY